VSERDLLVLAGVLALFALLILAAVVLFLWLVAG
jgi:hypothetical protein